MGTIVFQNPVHIINGRRTPIGRFGGGFRALSAVDLAFHAAAPVAEPVALHIDNVVFGNVLQAGVGMNLARQVALRLELAQSTPAYTVNMVCGSGLQAVALAAQEIEQGASKIGLAGGAESMTSAPYYSHGTRWGKKLGDATLVDAILADGLTDPLLGIEMGETAEKVADMYGILRDEQDAFALRSQQKAAAAVEHFRREIVPVTTREGIVERDEHPRPDTSPERLATLKPAFRTAGTVTAGNASGLNDGASALLLSDGEMVRSLGLTSRARIVACSRVGCDPSVMGLGPVGAIRELCEKTGWNLNDVDAVEINEAFAVQSIACARELGIADEKLNQRGGAIALGHPIGSSGARVLVTLLHLLEDIDGKRGIASLCIGGGMGIAMAIERS